VAAIKYSKRRTVGRIDLKFNMKDRRRFIGGSLAALVAAAARAYGIGPGPDEIFRGTVPLEGTHTWAPLNRLLGAGLDGRLFTDLSALDGVSPIVPTAQFYVRTTAPPPVSAAGWLLPFGGLVRKPRRVTFPELATRAVSRGIHLMECAGNSDPANFGLMSAAEWTGLPVADLLQDIQPAARDVRVRISGRDPQEPSATSTPGASWLFSRQDLERTGAFLATALNGAPLPPDHGHPVRLLVPGWYGCCCIKWVEAVDLLPDDAEATSQMREFASRTHQRGIPERARDFEAPAIDHAAMPIRIEKWSKDGRLFYRVVGIQWGGEQPASAFVIRFRNTEAFVPIEHCPMPASTATWSLWSHTWRPSEPRRYEIVVKLGDPTIRTRRLDLFFYTRAVTIDEV